MEEEKGRGRIFLKKKKKLEKIIEMKEICEKKFKRERKRRKEIQLI